MQWRTSRFIGFRQYGLAKKPESEYCLNLLNSAPPSLAVKSNLSDLDYTAPPVYACTTVSFMGQWAITPRTQRHVYNSCTLGKSLYVVSTRINTPSSKYLHVTAKPVVSFLQLTNIAIKSMASFFRSYLAMDNQEFSKAN